MNTPPSSSSGLVFFPEWPTLRVVGPDAASWLNGLVTCDVLSVGAGQGAWGCLLTKQGKIAAELQIVGEKFELFVAVSGGDAAATLEALDGYLVMEDAEIESSDRKWVVFDEQARAAVTEAGLLPSSLPWTQTPVFASSGPSAQMEALSSSFLGRALDLGGWRRWTLRQGVPRFGVDYDEKDNLHAASLERRTVDWQKGCYLGQEVVCMQDMRGKVKKRLVLLRAESGEIESGAELTTAAGEMVGLVTSSAGNVAIASVKAAYFDNGTALFVGQVATKVEPLRA